jgi:hypothetical protein
VWNIGREYIYAYIVDWWQSYAVPELHEIVYKKASQIPEEEHLFICCTQIKKLFCDKKR